MHFEFLLEELSMAVALERIVQLIVSSEHSFELHPHQGKYDLLGSPGALDSKLARKLRGYSHWTTPDLRVCVVVDRDTDDCVALKTRITGIAASIPMPTLARIAIEELEAWFFGDPDAIKSAYPRVKANLASKSTFRDPDSIAGGTWEALQRVLQRAGYYASGMPKVEVAARIAEHMDPNRNCSHSFRVFRYGLRREAGIP